MTAAQDIHIDLMHVLYVYSRVMGGASLKHIQCSDNRGVCRYVYGVQGYIYTYETRGVCWGACPPPPQGKFEFLGEIMLHLRPF